MPHYYSLGKIPPKRHTQFRQPDGTLYSEQLFSTEGFSSNSSLLYHIHPPTKILKAEEPVSVAPVAATSNILKHRSFKGFKIDPVADYIKSRKTVLYNNDVPMKYCSYTRVRVCLRRSMASYPLAMATMW
jgi:homogentisate 1,2-dioxygenase